MRGRVRVAVPVDMMSVFAVLGRIPSGLQGDPVVIMIGSRGSAGATVPDAAAAGTCKGKCSVIRTVDENCRRSHLFRCILLTLRKLLRFFFFFLREERLYRACGRKY